MSGEEKHGLGTIFLRTVFDGLTKGIKCCLVKAGNDWKIDFDTSSATKVNVLKNGQWILRLDGQHRGAKFEHININRKYWGIPDPHTRLSPRSLQVLYVNLRFC